MSPTSASIDAPSSVLKRAAEGCIYVGIAGAEPVAEGRPQQFLRRRHRRPFHDEMLTVEEVRRVFRIRRHRLETGEGAERRARPFPTVPNQILDAPGTRPYWMCAGGFWIPAREIESTRRAIPGREH